MFTYTRARRAALLFLFLAISVAGGAGPASAKLIPPPYPIGRTPPADGPTEVADVPGLLPWALVGLALALVAAGIVMVALRRHDHTHAAPPRAS